MFFQDRAEKIMEASVALEKGDISPLIFINRIAWKENKMLIRSIDDFESVDAARSVNNNDELFESDDETDEGAPSNQSNASLKLMPCLACLDKISEVVMQPCGHMKICAECWQIILNNHDTKVANFYENQLPDEFKPILKCPFCNSPINTYVNKIYT